MVKRACSQCSKPNAVAPARLCPTCKRLNAKQSKSKQHEAYVMKTYGIAAGDYDRLMVLQDGCCAICKGGKAAKRKLAVDHDHATGLPRGLLCRSCNYVLLGRIAKDDVTVLQRILEAAIAYYADTPYSRMLRDKR